MEPTLLEVPQQIRDAWHGGGWLGFAAIAVNLFVRGFRSEFAQSWLPPKLQWDSWSPFQRWGFTIATSYLGGAFTAAAGGVSWWQAAWGGAVAATSAMGIRKSKKVLSAPTIVEFPTLPPSHPFSGRTGPVE